MKMAEESSGCSDNGTDTRNTDRQFICGVVEGFYGRPWTQDQRKDLFAKMKNIGLNTYMYAPKDDFKHRAYWRELYSVEEAEQLNGLIQAAKENGIEFYYALSPGLDIVYSNSKEVACLRRKLEQVGQLGCNAFALLFDDIEPEISQTDKEVFQSFGHAQVSVTNEVYQNLNQPRFLFCPTEYCTARAVPNIQNSDYLNTIGSKLMPGIDIMWTGSKVVTKVVTVQSIQELSEVLRRKPVIWDNLHANDYDQKRLFLGPYSGRSTELIPNLRGVLTNPNCEFEPNFIAIHTLAQWSKCTADANCDLSADIKLETESENGSVEDIPTHIGPNTYHPKKALRIAIGEWLPEFNKTKTAFGKSVITASLAAVIPLNTPACLGSNNVKNCTSQIKIKTTVDVGGSLVPEINNRIIPIEQMPIAKELVNSLANPPIILNPLEPMDCNPSPCASPKHNSDAQMDDTQFKSEPSRNDSSQSESVTELQSKDTPSIDSAEEMQTESISESDEEAHLHSLCYDDIALLVDLFYLPFEHGNLGLQFLSEFQWLKTNNYLVSEFRRRKTTEPETPEIVEWYNRAKKFEEMTQTVGRLLTKLTFCKNRSLLYDLYPYVWDVKGVISLLNSYIKWLALGRIPTTIPGFMSPAFTWFSKGYKEAFSNGDQEPWLFRGGITGELQRLLPVETVSDLFLYKPPESPSSRIYTIRPYLPSDEKAVYDVCSKTMTDGEQIVESSKDHVQLIGDRYVGSYLTLNPEYCFVVEDENGVCGYALTSSDTNLFFKKMEVAWISELCKKYPLPSDKMNRGEPLTPDEEIVKYLHEPGAGTFEIPENIAKSYPSMLCMSLLPHVTDCSVSKRLLACVIAALKANGSHGIFCKLAAREKNITEFYSRLGFTEVQPTTNNLPEGQTFLCRAI